MCKDLKRNGPSAAIALDAAYTPVSNRVSSRSFFTIVAKSIIFAKFGFINVTVC
ncbi:hypothetical protein LCAZH_1050 [Lacticaseibacillus paracasei]|nr:hypothetical protein LCAZH_1050 [Lacticaseibacillus paracasei]AGP67930.1 Hypothetical protein LOCK919_1228 [Lacticaseibacillus paracasei]AKU59200.1 hypothetical protein LPL9_1146 [Lacticaseibacillus paracasei]EPC26229.1 hypothetical protein Lpp46_1773 [Lacticaseibacillus paracasei subsp. paracasei Lpp46]CAD7484143.1 conserved hypothetical protein [Lacticaseibacillus paracasei]